LKNYLAENLAKMYFWKVKIFIVILFILRNNKKFSDLKTKKIPLVFEESNFRDVC